MSIKDFSIYTLKEIRKMREEVLQSIKVVEQSIAGIPDSEVPTKKNIELDNLRNSLKRCNEEIENRDKKINSEEDTSIKEDRITGSNSRKGKMYIGFFLLIIVVSVSIFLLTNGSDIGPEINNPNPIPEPDKDSLLNQFNTTDTGIAVINYIVENKIKRIERTLGVKPALEMSDEYRKRTESDYINSSDRHVNSLIIASDLHYKIKNFADAEKCLEDALTILYSIKGEAHKDSRNARERLLDIYHDDGKFEKEADLRIQHSKIIFKNIPPGKLPNDEIKKCIEEICKLYKDAGKEVKPGSIEEKLKN